MSDTEDPKKEEEVAPDDEATEKESRGEEETETPEESADEEDSQNEAIETIEDSSDEADSSSDQNGAKNGECLRNGSIKATEEETGSEACALPQKRKSEALGTDEEEVESSEKKAKSEEEAPEAESTA